MAGIILHLIHFEKHYNAAVREDMKELVPPMQLEGAMFSHYSKRLAVTMLIVMAGGFLAAVLFIKEQQAGELIMTDTGSYIERASANGRQKDIDVVASIDKEQTQLTIQVEPVKYTKEEFMAICDEISQELPNLIRGENDDLEHVTTDLELIERYGNYPITIAWSCNDYTYIHTDGSVNTEALQTIEDSVPVELSAVISHDTYEESIRFLVQFVKPSQTSEIQTWERLKAFLSEQQKSQRTKETFILPSEFEGKALFIREKKERMSFGLLILSCVAGIILFFTGNQDLHKETAKRKEKLLQEYPEFVSKLMLFVGSGMTTKAALSHLCKDYGNAAKRTPKEKHYLYDELKYMIHSMENGVFEVHAYEEFGKRCKVRQYQKLMALLSQNSKKGTKDLLQQLELEAKETFEVKISEVRRLGEKAGTKLLLPMILMLGIVMVIIIVPAFLSYQI
jgi:hypothetical protein